jgi:membrane protease subunit (stomatin/prohibitin family)
LGLRDLIKGQLLDVIEYQTDDKRILAHRFENGGKQIMIGAQLTVRPGQIAVFINEGEIADVYTEGQYELTTSNMPVLTKLKSWKYGFESPFKVDIYFILIDEKIQQPWGTPSKIPIKDPDFGIIRIGANGYYSYKVDQPELFIKTLVGTDSQFTVEECRPHINGKIVSSFTDYFSESKVTYFDAYSNMDEFSEGVAGKIGETFSGFGLSLSDFVVKELRAPENVEKAMDDRAAVGAMGGMGMYQAKVMTDATADAAVTMAGNEGGGMGPMGMQMGAGVAMGGMMGNMMGNNMQPGQTAQSTQEAKPIVQCPKCNGSVAGGTKFCPHCGNNMAPAVSGVSCVKCGMTLLAGAKFCPECGTKQSAVCSQCGVELTPGTKFCPDCGNKQ